ncbi:unnamed protein product [Durusdinium trenchii]|uniref:Uncharacterized protein n=1 Tax=Durusdinium trenchii TaxID=1381693 RepID=A0ABP0SS40_9DINO
MASAREVRRARRRHAGVGIFSAVFVWHFCTFQQGFCNTMPSRGYPLNASLQDQSLGPTSCFAQANAEDKEEPAKVEIPHAVQVCRRCYARCDRGSPVVRDPHTVYLMLGLLLSIQATLAKCEA